MRWLAVSHVIARRRLSPRGVSSTKHWQRLGGADVSWPRLSFARPLSSLISYDLGNPFQVKDRSGEILLLFMVFSPTCFILA